MLGKPFPLSPTICSSMFKNIFSWWSILSYSRLPAVWGITVWPQGYCLSEQPLRGFTARINHKRLATLPDLLNIRNKRFKPDNHTKQPHHSSLFNPLPPQMLHGPQQSHLIVPSSVSLVMLSTHSAETWDAWAGTSGRPVWQGCLQNKFHTVNHQLVASHGLCEFSQTSSTEKVPPKQGQLPRCWSAQGSRNGESFLFNVGSTHTEQWRDS